MLQPRSWEAVAAIQLKAAQLAHEMAREHPAEAHPAAVNAQPNAGELGTLSEAEAQAAAHAILAGRRAARQAAEAGAPPPAEPAQPEPAPALRLARPA